jgi:hypothetical protein
MILFILLFITAAAFGQTSEWFPSNLNIQPFTSNILEPRAGFNYHLNRGEIRLDIGTSKDVYHYNSVFRNFSIGADLFTYTRLRGESNFHFPVETIDYFFGVNAGYKIINKNKEYGLRFRVSHISAHLVDGQYYKDSGWRNGQLPRVYSREFVEMIPFIRFNGFRSYAGLTYLFHTNPSFVGKNIYQAGFDYFIEQLAFNSFTPFAAYDFKLIKIHSYTGNNIISAGIKFGDYRSKGLSLILNYISGMSIHGEYFDKHEKYFSLGFNLDI